MFTGEDPVVNTPGNSSGVAEGEEEGCSESSSGLGYSISSGAEIDVDLPSPDSADQTTKTTNAT